MDGHPALQLFLLALANGELAVAPVINNVTGEQHVALVRNVGPIVQGADNRCQPLCVLFNHPDDSALYTPNGNALAVEVRVAA